MAQKLYIPRREWLGPVADRPRIEVPTPRVYVHHSVTTEPGPKASYDEDLTHARLVYNMHDEYNGAYSFFFMKSGRVFEFCGFGRSGAHTYAHNDDGHGFCFAGNYMTDKLTPAQEESFLEMVRLGVRRGQVRNTIKHPVDLIAHREVGAAGAGPGSTACPGTNVISELPRLTRELHRNRR